MGQIDILKSLKQNSRKWFNAKQISELTGISISPTYASLHVLRRTDFVQYKIVDRKKRVNTYMYKHKKL